MNSLLGELTVLRSPPQTLTASRHLTYSLTVNAPYNYVQYSLSGIEVYIVHRAHDSQPASTAHAQQILTLNRMNVIARIWTFCVPPGTYWLEFRVTTGIFPSSYTVNHVHGGNPLSAACKPTTYYNETGKRLLDGYLTFDLI